MGSAWTAISWNITAQEANQTLELDKTRANWWHLLSAKEWLQLGRLAERPAALLDGLLALQTVARSRRDWAVDECLTRTSARKCEKKAKWTRLIIIDSQAVQNTCNASVESKGFCFYKATNGIKRHLAVDTLGFPTWCAFPSCGNRSGVASASSRTARAQIYLMMQDC